MSRQLLARRVVLVLTAVVFAAIAVGSLVVPARMAEPLGLALVGVNGLSEFRAIYVGLWAAHAAILVWAAIRIREVVLGDVCAILLLGQVFGRLLSAALDGVPDSRLWPTAVAEALGGILLLLLRPRSRA